ncbi:MAG: sel1 repeat family protein [Akkermansia sp.]|nr:sel1 repeat family protein [Akkermansia sp.]
MKLNTHLFSALCCLAMPASSIAQAEVAPGIDNITHYLQAAESGDAEAMYRLAIICEKGKGSSPDYEEFNKWIRKAAEAGHAEAQFRLAVRYLFGAYSQPSDSETQEWLRLSVEWFRKAAEQGHAEAQCNLGVRYYCGQGVEASDSEAAKWYRKAAEQEHAQAQVFLGDMCLEGQGVPQSFVEAAKWYHKATELYRKEAAQGNSFAMAQLHDLRKKMDGLKARAAEKSTGDVEPLSSDDEISIDLEL